MLSCAPGIQLCWRSFKLTRAVSSTLAAESQAMAVATSTVEWLSFIVSELLDGPFDLRNCRDIIQKRPPIAITDCKYLYDHLNSPSSPTAVEDRRTSIDITIIRESLKACAMTVRWAPTNRMLADGFTKDAGDPIDLLRSCIRASSYQVSPESEVWNDRLTKRECVFLSKPNSLCQLKMWNRNQV